MTHPTRWRERGSYTFPVLFSPYTGGPRDARDIASDPQGLLIVQPGAPLVPAAPTPPAQQDDALIDDALSEYRHLSDTCLGEKEQQEADALLLWRLDRIRKPKDDEALEVLLADHQRALRLLDDVREWIRSDVAGGACWPVDRFTRAELLARIDAELEGEK